LYKGISNNDGHSEKTYTLKEQFLQYVLPAFCEITSRYDYADPEDTCSSKLV